MTNKIKDDCITVDDEGDVVPEMPVQTKEAARTGYFNEFTFPLAVSGKDPDNPEMGMTKMFYPTLTFKRAASARSVRMAVKRFMKMRFKMVLTKKQVWDIFELGLEHMFKVREQAQKTMDNWDDNSNAVISQAQKNFDKLAEEGKIDDSTI